MSILALIAPVVTYWATVWIVVAGLVVWAVGSGLRLQGATARIHGELRRARRLVDSTADAAQFARRFAEINRELNGFKLLGQRWREWAETLIVGDKADQPVRATSRPTEWFDLGLYADTRVDLRYHGALPGLLVGAGLLFTFLGLAVALEQAGTLVTAETAEARNNALKTLLDTASFKFIASLVGLGCSILYALFRKGQLRRVEAAVAGFCESLERRTLLVTPALLQAQANDAITNQLALAYSSRELLKGSRDSLEGIATTLTASHKMHERIHEEVQLFNQSLAVNLGEKLDAALDKRLGEHLGKLATVLEERLGERFERVVETLAGRIHERDERGVVELLRQLVERLEGGSAQHMQTVAAELGQLGGRLGEISAQLQGAAAGLTDHVGAAAETLGRSVAGVSASMSDGAAKAAAQLDRAVAQLDEVLRGPTERFAHEAGNLADAAARLQDGLGRLRGLAVELGTPLERAASGFGVAAERVHAATEPLQAAAQGIAATAERLGGAAEQLREVLAGQAELGRDLDGAARRFATVDESLAGTIDALREGLDGFAAKVREVVQTVDSELAKSVTGLQSLVRDLDETVTTFNDHRPRS